MFKKIGFGFLAKIYSAAIMFLISVLAARVLGPELFGFYNIVITLIPVFAYLYVFGQDQYLLSFLSSKSKFYLENKSSFRTAHSAGFSCGLFIITLMIFLLIIAVGFTISNELIYSFLAILTVGFAYSVRRLLIINFRVQNFEIKAILPETVLYPTFFFIGLLFLYYFGSNIENKFVVVLLLLFLSALISLYPFLSFMHKCRIQPLKLSHGHIWIKQGWIFALLTISEASIFFIDRIIVFYHYGPSYLSYYQVAIRFVEILLVFESAYLLISMPKIASLFAEKNFSEINFICKKQTRFIFIFNMSGSIFIFFASSFLIGLYGDDYKDSIELLQIFCLYMVLASVLGPSTYVCTVLKQEFFSLCVALFFVLLFICLWFYLRNEISLIQLVILKCSCDFVRRLICSIRLYRVNVNVFLR